MGCSKRRRKYGYDKPDPLDMKKITKWLKKKKLF